MHKLNDDCEDIRDKRSSKHQRLPHPVFVIRHDQKVEKE